MQTQLHCWKVLVRRGNESSRQSWEYGCVMVGVGVPMVHIKPPILCPLLVANQSPSFAPSQYHSHLLANMVLHIPLTIKKGFKLTVVLVDGRHNYLLHLIAENKGDQCSNVF